MKNDLMKVQAEIGGWNIARSVHEIPLSNIATLVNPMIAMLGSDKFTQIYFRTASNNIYRIVQKNNKWILENINHRTMYEFTITELHYSRLTLEKQFFYGNGNQTSPIVEIIAVCTERVYREFDAPVSNIKSIFKTAMQF